LKKAIEHGTGGAVFMGNAIGFPHLAEDFRFAEKKRIEASGYAEEMTDGGAVIVLVEQAVQYVGPDGVKFAEEGGKAGGAFVGSFGWDAVEFAAIAGGEDQGFFE
jgi:hypothetical protein